MWQELSAEGKLRLRSSAHVELKFVALEQALSELCMVISRETGNAFLSGFDRARALRSKPDAGGKSHYECINQLIHYWYCCAGATYLFGKGFENLVMRPTGHDNVADDQTTEGPFDLEADHPEHGRLVAEVFCVSQGLWAEKMRKTRIKLSKSSAEIRCIFYNSEAKPRYLPKTEWLVILGVDAKRTVQPIHSMLGVFEATNVGPTSRSARSCVKRVSG